MLAAAPIEELVITDTIAVPPTKKFPRMKVLSVAGLLAQAIASIHSNESVSELFEYTEREDLPKVALA